MESGGRAAVSALANFVLLLVAVFVEAAVDFRWMRRVVGGQRFRRWRLWVFSDCGEWWIFDSAGGGFGAGRFGVASGDCFCGGGCGEW